jgi:hypothetical protein
VQYNITVTQPEESVEGSFTVAVGTDSAVSSNTTATAGTTITLAATAGTGYDFTQWTVTGVTLTDNTANPATFTMPEGDVTVTFTAQVVSYTVTFNANGGNDGPAPVTVTKGSTVFEPDTTGMTNTDENLTFGGWFTDSTLRYPVEFPITVNEDIEVYAKWDNPYVLVVYTSKGGQLAGQNVYLTAGTYKLGAEFKSGRDSQGKPGRLLIRVIYRNADVSTTAWQKEDHIFPTGFRTQWTLYEEDLVAPVNGWYCIRILDGKLPNTETTSAKEVYPNRFWLYPDGATSSTQNKLEDADFARNTLHLAENQTSDRLLNISNGNPQYSNSHPAWIPDNPNPDQSRWLPVAVGYWAKTGSNVAISENPTIAGSGE